MPMAPRSILITNITLRTRTGTEVMTAELAFALAARGHHVAIYSPRIGDLAMRVMAHGIPVTDRIETLTSPPDIIHGHHNTPLAVAMVRFPATPAIFVCHDVATPYDEPIIAPRIGAYIAVDQGSAARLLTQGVEAAQLHLIPNAVDLDRFICRTNFAATPRTALAVTKARAPWLPAVREACATAGIALTEVGPGVNRSVDDLPARMRDADIVFGWARSAIEAAATGASVILCSEYGFGGLLTTAIAERYPEGQLGRQILPMAVTPAGISDAILRYDPVDTARVATIVRQKLSLDDMTTRYEAIYDQVLAAPAESASTGLATFLERTFPRFDLPSDLHHDALSLDARLIRLDAWLGRRTRLEQLPVPDLPFDNMSPALGLLHTGWADPEAWGVWTIAPVATIDLPIAHLTAWDGNLVLRCNHYFPAGDEQDRLRPVEIRAAGRLLARLSFLRRDYGRSESIIHRLAIPGSLWRGQSGALRLAFHILAPQSPLDAVEGDDPRRLGLALESISGP
ncbi:glycosyltransferase [Acidiphilium acidophilum]|uniref:glycosyltransferase n=1 Tax=Acidiphilium acidophilum TaxID=76588 RepID=UPI002E8E656A|nr:glycosyltransferase [Acidiphilium acidophilum]